MKARMIPIRFLSLLLAVCLLPMAALAGVADSNALAYEKALQMLITSSLTDGEKLELIREQFEQAGSYQFGVDYLTLTDALMILQSGNVNRFDEALESVRRLSRIDKFVSHYSSHADRSGQPVLPDLETLAQYIAARKLEAYQDLAGAVLLYDQYPVLDAAQRAGLLINSFKLSQYEKAAALLLEGDLGSIKQAAVLFEELGDFRDSPQRLQECGERMEATPTLEVVVVTDVPATEVPATEVPATAVPAAEASEAPVVAAAVAAAVEEVMETVETAAAAEAKVEEAVAQVMPAADKAKAAIWHTFTKGQEEYLAKAVAGFNASQDKYVIELLSQPYDGFLDSVKNSVIAGVGPDIIFNYASEAASYVKGGYLADLSQYIYDEEIGIEGFEGSLVDGVMNGEVKAFEDGGIHYLPAYTTGPILFYNKTLFDELKIAVPTTWEEMEAAAKTIKEQKGIAALGCDSLTDLVQMFIMETPGAGYIDVANKAVLFDTPEVRAKIQWLVDMVKNGYFLVKSTGNYFSEDFNAGIVASYIGSSAGYPYITPADGKFEFAMAPVPAATWYPSWNRGPIVFYYKDDARAQAAYEFVKYFISADVNAGWVEAVTALAPYSWTKETDAYKAYVAQDTLAAQALNAVAENLDVAGSLPAVEGANVVRNALKAAIEKAALGDMTVDEAWTEAVTVSNAALQGK